MAYTRGRCSNFDYCSIADARRDVEVRVGDDFICPECGKPLKAPPVTTSGRNSALVPALIGGGILVLVGGAVFFGMRMGSSGPAPHATQTAQTAPPPQPAPQPAAQPTPAPSAPPVQAAPPPPPPPALNVLVRLAGSPFIGSEIAPKIAAAYLTQIGDTDVKATPGDGAEIKVVGMRGDHPEAIVIDNTGQAAAFKALVSHQADIVMADTRITPAEYDALGGMGDMTGTTAEHILGLNALAVVVNPANALPSLSRDQIKSVFTGTIKDWSGLALTPGPIDAYAGAPGSAAAQAFSALALGGGALAPSVKTLAGGADVAQAVVGDPRGIGVVELAHVGAARAVPIADVGSSPVAATNHAAVAADDYPLAYRLYLYTAPGSAGGIAQRFVEYALSPAGQAIVEAQGAVSQTLKPAAAAAAAVPDTTLGKFKAFVAGAKHLAINFHFNPNSTDLDQKGTRDLDRVMNYVLSNHYTPDHLILVGFADNQGDPAQNIAVSKKRADAVAALFTARGLPPGKVAGFGSELPIADNNTEEGREKNRRVEVFIAP
jgi:phosphate transport system substrate-binding protein